MTRRTPDKTLEHIPDKMSSIMSENTSDRKMPNKMPIECQWVGITRRGHFKCLFICVFPPRSLLWPAAMDWGEAQFFKVPGCAGQRLFWCWISMDQCKGLGRWSPKDFRTNRMVGLQKLHSSGTSWRNPLPNSRSLWHKSSRPPGIPACFWATRRNAEWQRAAFCARPWCYLDLWWKLKYLSSLRSRQDSKHPTSKRWQDEMKPCFCMSTQWHSEDVWRCVKTCLDIVDDSSGKDSREQTMVLCQWPRS